MARSAVILIIAVVLDLFQVVIGLGMTGISAGATSVLNLIPVIGTAAATAGTALGAAIGYVEGTALSLGFGTLITTLLIYNKMFYPGSVLSSYLGEMVPLVNLFPCWTALVARSAYITYKKERALNANSAYAQVA